MTALGDDATVPVNPNLLEADQGGKGVKPYNNHLSHARVERRVAVRLRRGPRARSDSEVRASVRLREAATTTMAPR